ncbi:MAG: GDSL-type esterase/lipase family protein [Eubacteriales bacterium]|nr:GDSL-type esterase/lipase family protein [Eubacteriales bacterium]
MEKSKPRTYRIFCYGDSNTYGYDPRDGSRYEENERWPDVLQSILNACASEDMRYSVLADGLNGREIDVSSEGEEDISGAVYRRTLFRVFPFDLLLIMLGSNNIPKGDSAEKITAGLLRMCNSCETWMEQKTGQRPSVLILAPPEFREQSTFFVGNLERMAKESRALPSYFRRMANSHGYDFLDSNDVIEAGLWDGIHMTPENHRTLARAAASKVLKIAGRRDV